MKKISTRMLAVLSLLAAMNVIFARFLSVQAWNVRIGFSFLPLAVAGMLYGPLAAGIVGAVGDIVGALLFPTGAYFPGFTLTAFITGAIFGLCLYKKRGWVNIIPAVLLNQIVCSLLLNSLWISVLYGSPFVPLMQTRAIQCAIVAPVQLVTLWLLAKAYPRLKAVAVK